MAKDKDLNDRLKEDPDKLKADIQKDIDDLINGVIEPSNIENIENFNQELKVIRELNEKHIFIADFGGKNVVTNTYYNEVTKSEEIKFLSLDTFKGIYMHRTISVGIGSAARSVPIGEFWLKDSRKNYVDSIIYDPLKAKHKIITINDKKYINIWEGFSIQPKKGSWRKTQRHIYKILCNSDPIKFKYVYKWLAWMFQNPDKQAEVAIVFKGEKGTGKTCIFEQIKQIFGSHGMVISDPNRLTGRYNDHLRALSFLFCDEVYYPGNREIEGRIKALITNASIDIEGKFKEAITMRNRLHIVMATNNEWVIPATIDERRFFIEKINNIYSRSNSSDNIRKRYFDALWDEMDNGGKPAMLYSFLNYNLKQWHPRDSVPNTQELKEQIELNLNSLLSAIKQLLEDGVFPGEPKEDGYDTSADSLYTYLEHIEPNCTKFSAVKKAKAIKRLGAVKGRMPRVGRVKWSFPELNVVRKNWDKEFGPIIWDNQSKWTMIKTDY